jgi:hypothetical protein
MSHSAFHKRNATTTPQDRITPSPITPAQDTPNNQLTPSEGTKENREENIPPPLYTDKEESSSKNIEQSAESQKSAGVDNRISTNSEAIKQEGPFDDPFLMDSLNGVSLGKQEDQKNKDVLMGLLKESIAYFEQNNAIQKKTPKENISNQTTTANSLNRSVEFSHGFQKLSENSVSSSNDIKYLKNENLSLQLKYNELKLANKKLLADYSKLRSQIEDIKQVKMMYDDEVRSLEQRLKDTELRLEHMTDMYTREKIEKENNSAAFKSIIEQMANNRSYSPTFDRPIYTNQSFAPNHCHCPTYCFGSDFNEEISSRIKKIEEELGDKEKELKTLKMNVSRQRMSPPLYTSKNISPMQSTSKMSFNEKGFFFSPPSTVHNTCKATVKEPAPAAESQNQRTSTVAHKPKYSDLKSMPLNKKEEGTFKPSPKASPGYDRQPLPKSIMKKQKTAAQLNSKH